MSYSILSPSEKSTHEDDVIQKDDAPSLNTLSATSKFFAVERRGCQKPEETLVFAFHANNPVQGKRLLLTL